MPNTDSKTYIVNDQPTETDALDFMPYVETLADIIQTGNTPLTIGVFGTWGSGKTSLMKMVKKSLPNDFTVAWFDAWKYDKEETLWRAFILSVLTAVRSTIKEGQPTEDLEYLETMLYRAIEIERAGSVTIDLAKLGGAVAKGGVQLALSFIPGGVVLSEFVKKVQELGAEALTNEATEAIQRERTKIQIEQVRFLEQFQDKFRALVEQHISNNGKRLVVFVDDLDRCLPEKAIEVLEAIKLFLDAENCVFMLGLDQEVIARGIEMKYKELGSKQDSDNQQRFTIEGVRYLEKIIQLPFQIPPVEQNDMGDFVYRMSTDWPHEECPKIFAVGLGDNPRQIKRTVNVFLMLWKLAERRKEKLEGSIKPIRLAKVVAIQAVYPELYNLLLKDEPRYLRDLEEHYRTEPIEKKINPADLVDFVGGSDDKEKGPQPKENIPLHVEPPPALVPFLSRRGAAAVRRILTLHKPEKEDANFIGLPSDELRLYFTLTRRTEIPQVPTFGTPLIFSEPQIVNIPAGKFLMGSTEEQIAQAIKDGADKDWVQNEQPQHTVELLEYYIGKYPITNREYQAFVRDAKYYSPTGWDGVQFPDEKGSHPVVGVSWDAAVAYCQWLSEKSGKVYRLPTEAEWEKAARGEKGWIYPWGDHFDPWNANTREAKIENTSEVGQFSTGGDSPYGCADMAGNVWEWCSNWFDEKEYKNKIGKSVKDHQDLQNGQFRVLRGGSFNENREFARCTYRRRLIPSDSIITAGFRIVSSPTKVESGN